MRIDKRSFLVFMCALSIGVAVGVLTLIGQKYLPGSLNSLANSGAVWLIPAYFAATLGKSRRTAIALGVETLAACVVSYYAFEAVVNGHVFPVGNYFLYVWLACAALFGALFGAGAFLRGQGGARSHWGASLLPAAFLSDGLHETIHLSDYAHMIPAVVGRIVVGLVLYLILFRREVFRPGPLISFAALTALGLIGFEVLRLATL